MAQTENVIGGRYRLLSPLASGGMGTVWRAEHTELRVQVALKMLLPEVASTHETEVRFRREAQAAARLKSPHIVQVHDFGIFEGRPYLAMELLHGEDLAARLQHRGALRLEECAEIITAVAEGLDLAHAHGIIHRDLKPANIFISKEGPREVVKLLDFGVAKIESALDTGSTGGGLVGSPAYMSPEQVWSEPLTKATDLWSLAVVALEMVLGDNPFNDGPLAKVFERIVRDVLPRPTSRRPGLPPSMDSFFERALVREPAKRFASATDLARAFRDAIAVEPLVVDATVDAPPLAKLRGSSLPAPSPRWAWILGVVAFGLLAVVLVPMVRSGPQTSSSAASSTTSAPTTMNARASLGPPTGSARAVASAVPAIADVSASKPSSPGRTGIAPRPVLSVAAHATPSATPSAVPMASPVDPVFGIPKDR